MSLEARLHNLRISLDQSWDLLRQRRALREAGLDPGHGDWRRSVLRAVARVDGQAQRE
jgi:Protein of unknown function (DUF2630)